MEVDRYAAIVFDLFGTLVPVYRHHEVLARMAAVLRLDKDLFIPAFTEDTRDARETGQIGLAENIRVICSSLGGAAEDTEILRAVALRREFTVRSLSPRDGAIAVLDRLRARGKALALITDCCEAVSSAWESVLLAAHLDVSILSCRVGVRKPHPMIYRLACDALSVRPSSCLFVGDGGSHELSGARRVGMDPVLLSVPEESEHDPYRPDAIGWTGPVIHSLDELAAA